MGAELLELLRRAQKIDDFLKLAFGVFHVSDVIEGDAQLVAFIAPGRTLDVAVQHAAAQRIANTRKNEEKEQAQNYQRRQHKHHQHHDPLAAGRFLPVIHFVFPQFLLQLALIFRSLTADGEFLAVAKLLADGLNLLGPAVRVFDFARDAVRSDQDFADLVFLQKLPEITVVDDRRAEIDEKQDGHYRGEQNQPDPSAAGRGAGTPPRASIPRQCLTRRHAISSFPG